MQDMMQFWLELQQQGIFVIMAGKIDEVLGKNKKKKQQFHILFIMISGLKHRQMTTDLHVLGLGLDKWKISPVNLFLILYSYKTIWPLGYDRYDLNSKV